MVVCEELLPRITVSGWYILRTPYSYELWECSSSYGVQKKGGLSNMPKIETILNVRSVGLLGAVWTDLTLYVVFGGYVELVFGDHRQ